MELLAPAGSFLIGLEALYQGADAVYLGLNKFGARASATNFTLDELKEITKIAHLLNKKVYVTVNTIIKEEELEDAYRLIDDIAKCNCDGVIVCDLGLVDYLLTSYPTLECHISTQTGVKSVEDAKFFKSIGVKRVVLARELDIDTIKKIKEEVDIELEVFVHGSLCVSYSGACYMSSLLSQRSANRGRCKQNCRHTYSLLEDDKVILKDLKLLSMKDLNSIDYIEELKKYVDSFKIEGRMKDLNYVSKVVQSYRAKLDGKQYNELNNIFHRNYTKGFLNKATLGEVVYSKGNKNIGTSIGRVLARDKLFYKIMVSNINRGDRLRFITKHEDYYVDVLNIYDKSKSPTDKLKGVGYIKLERDDLILDSEFYYIDKTSSLKLNKKNFIPLTLDAFLVDDCLYITTSFLDKTVTVKSNTLEQSKSIFIDSNMIKKQFNRLEYHPFYIEKVNINFTEKYFITLKELNNMRKSMLNELYKENNRHICIKKDINVVQYDSTSNSYITCNCFNSIQANVLKKYIDEQNIYLKGKNYIDYNSKTNLKSINLKGDTYASLLNVNLKSLGYYFNVLNSRALYFLTKVSKGAFVNLSIECSKTDLKNIYNSFLANYKYKPNIDFLVYGKAKLMTLKYCPLNHLNMCDNCNKHTYHIKDDWSKFRLLHDKCNTIILNQNPTCLFNEIDYILKYAKRIVLDFTDETEEEVEDIIKKVLSKDKTKLINSTNGLFLRKII